jgi:uncharacterized membrane protein YoaK (UPF0700 family)
MATVAKRAAAPETWTHSADDAADLARLEARLPPLLSVIAGMVDLMGFFKLGSVFPAHITGNLVLVAAAAVRGGPLNMTQALAIPIFVLAVAAIWLVARVSNQGGRRLTRLLLSMQCLLLVALLIFCVATQPSARPHGVMAGIALMIAVSAMACQFAVFRLSIPDAISTAVMTGNLTNTVLSTMDLLSAGHPLAPTEAKGRLKRSLHLLLGFLLGCAVGAAAIPWLGDWAWSLPAALAALAVRSVGQRQAASRP